MFPRRASFLALQVALFLAASGAVAQGVPPDAVRHAVEAHVGKTTTAEPDNSVLWEPGYPGGAVIAVVLGPQLFIFPFGCALGTQAADNGPCTDGQGAGAPMTPASVFDLASVGKLFAAVSLAHTTNISLQDSPSKYITDLKGACINNKTLSEIASMSSGLPDYPSKCYAHNNRYGYQDFIDSLNCWGTAVNPPNTCPNPPPQPAYYIYSDQGYILLRLVLAQYFTTPFSSVLQTLTQAVGMTQTAMIDSLNELPSSAVQGYGCYLPPEAEEEGVESGCTGEPVPMSKEVTHGWYQDKDGNGSQIWSSAPDMGRLALLALNLSGSFPADWQQAMNTTEKVIFTGCAPNQPKCDPPIEVGMAWQRSAVKDGTTILGKNGVLPFSSTYIGLAPDAQVAVVILVNRGGAKATVAGQQILDELAAIFGKTK
jgi:CubicO group peptidase (beta-lactamase class C family)